MADQRKNMKITKKKTGEDGEKVVTDVDKLATKTREELMREQRELMIDERTEFEKRGSAPVPGAPGGGVSPRAWARGPWGRSRALGPVPGPWARALDPGSWALGQGPERSRHRALTS